ncbi:MAG TPA: hypothetical protein VE954_43125 [Oligoflexus sp.]|uniref:hypothetical protein n=1 Tax=Oligoflexus sp. TaxID=1971216 RepID=UPI002D51F9DF|nr:hypothetical protein [Oligoflexus sp.]HYX39937.1 hypothetical protein [Oligoflexus sp.]
MMEYLAQMLADTTQERTLTQVQANGNSKQTVTVKTKPAKKEQGPEAPLDAASANLPQGVLDMMGMGQAAPQQPSLPPELLQMLLSQPPSPAPTVDPMANQIPMNMYGV